MPELPEVEAARRYVEKFCLGLTIRKVYTKEVGGGPRDGLFDEIVLDTPLTELQVQKSLVGRKISNVHRKGKQLWIEFSGGDLVAMFHFGMTGSILMQGHDIPLYFRSNSNDFKEWPPKFTKFMVEFSDGTNLAFRDPRRLGRIKIVQPEECQQVLRKLAIDPTTMQIPNPTMIRKQLRGLTAPIKAVLLDQERIFCGIGNYLADEILYQARIHPSSKACALSEAHLAAMIVSMQSILKIAIDAGADYKLFPADWLFHARWSKAKSKTSKISLPNGESLHVRRGTYIAHCI